MPPDRRGDPRGGDLRDPAPGFTKLDLVTCRNLLIYLAADLQQKLLPLFHNRLNPDGVLMLGSLETVGVAACSLAALPGKTRLYRPIEPAATVPRPRPERAVGMGNTFERVLRTAQSALVKRLAEQALLGKTWKPAQPKATA